MELHRRKQAVIIASAAALVAATAGALWGPPVVRYAFPSAPPPPPELPLELLWTKAFPGEDAFTYDVAARIRNRSATKGVKKLAYRFELLGEGERVLASRTGESYLRRGEAKYIVENSLGAAEPAERVRLVVVEAVLVEDAEPPPPLVLQGREFREGTLSGVVLNQTAVAIARVDVAALLLDGGGSPIRARATYFSRLLPGEERGFEIRWSQPGPAAREDLEVSTNVLDSANYLIDTAQPLER